MLTWNKSWWQQETESSKLQELKDHLPMSVCLNGTLRNRTAEWPSAAVCHNVLTEICWCWHMAYDYAHWYKKTSTQSLYPQRHRHLTFFTEGIVRFDSCSCMKMAFRLKTSSYCWHSARSHPGQLPTHNANHITCTQVIDALVMDGRWRYSQVQPNKKLL